jgi:hypothetical protein
MLKIREKWHNFARKFENYSESGRNRLQSKDRFGVGRKLLNTGFSCPFWEIWHPYFKPLKFNRRLINEFQKTKKKLIEQNYF